MRDFVQAENNRHTDSLKEIISKSSDVFTEKFDESIKNVQTMFDQHHSRTKRSISNMKDSCTNFFSQYDKALDLVQKRFVEINETFIDY